MIQENLEKLWEKIESACQKCSRLKKEISLIAVTKTVPVAEILKVADFGITTFAESRIQEAESKIPEIKAKVPNALYHMIGHLQSNKALRAVKLFDTIESLDSVELLLRIARLAKEENKVQRCLLEIKISEESSKSGLAPSGVAEFLGSARGISQVKIEGMMCVAPFFENAERTRPYFAKAREIFERNFLKQGQENPILSMGMSHDFEFAIMEGATEIRIGSAIFGERKI